MFYRISGRSTLGPTATASGPVPTAPTHITSITKDSGATVSFLAPSSNGGNAISSYTVTPYVSGSAQSPTTVPSGSLGTITGSDGNSYLQASVSGLTNGTAYTFSVHANTVNGAGAESAQSGANTPLSGLVFGDDFNGASGGPIDPEWYIYNRCGYIAQSEIEWYLPSQVSLDGSSNLLLTAQKTPHSGPSYPSDGNTVRNQSWISGACQSNTRAFAPASGNTMTFEARQQVCPDIGGGMWPGLFWLEGSFYLNAWKTDPQQSGWDNQTQAEIDPAEWNPSQVFTPDDYLNNVFCGSLGSQTFAQSVNTSTDFSAGLHVFTVKWKPGVSVTFLTDGTQTNSDTSSSAVPISGAQFFLLLYLQIVAGTATATQTCKIDYVRVYDQNLG